ncbi:MAG: Ppx/GppA phosphatase family protein [Acidobacteriota bacterium]
MRADVPAVEGNPEKPSRRRRVPSAYPYRCASIDVGSNAMRFLAAEFSGPGEYRVLESGRNPVRLGHGVFLGGRLHGPTADRAVEVLSEYRRRLDDLRIEDYRAVATSAVRESQNGKEFLREVEKRAGIRLETIHGSEEARLIYRAVQSRVDLSGRRWLLVDLGGGSVEVTLADGSGILWTESHTMGAVRLLEELTGGAEDPGRFFSLVGEYVGTLKTSRDLGPPPLSMAATGGNIETLAQIALAPVNSGGVARLGVGTLEKTVRHLSRLSYRERVATLGIREDRADVILPAALVYLRLARLAGAREIRVPFVGLREGIALDLADSRTSPAPGPAHRERQVEEAVLPLGRKYAFDEGHGRQVAALALSLFDQTAKVHGLGDPERTLLHAAALLHDIGSFVSYTRHHKHTLYLISQSNLAGFSARETLLVANVARYHRRSMPKPTHEAFAALDRRERFAVAALASILRLADALDREHQQRVQRVEAEAADSVLRLRVEGTGDLLLEGWSLKRKADLFTQTFGLRVEVALAEGGS